MYISNGIAYAGEQEPVIKVCGVRPLPGHKLWLRFTTGETKVFDFNPLLKDAGFAPLKDEHTFAGVYIDYGVTVWNDGAGISISAFKSGGRHRLMASDFNRKYGGHGCRTSL